MHFRRDDNLYLYTFDDGQTQQLTDFQFPTTFPAIAPDGSSLVFTVNDDYSRSLPEGVFLYDLTTGELRDFSIPNLYFYALRYSPDSQWVAYSVYSPEGTHDLHVKRIRDGATVRITEGVSNGLPYWHPDGNMLLFSVGSRSGEPTRFYTVDLISGETHLLVDVPSDAYFRNWTVDGEGALFSLYVDGDERGIWAVSTDGEYRLKLTSDLYETYDLCYWRNQLGPIADLMNPWVIGQMGAGSGDTSNQIVIPEYPRIDLNPYGIPADGDEDEDGITNLYDKCPFVRGSALNQGCPF